MSASCRSLEQAQGRTGLADAHPWWRILHEKLRDFVPSRRSTLDSEQARIARVPSRRYARQLLMRRGGDSNPRYLAVRRFSRPVHSTTLPPLRRFQRTAGAGQSNVVSETGGVIRTRWPVIPKNLATFTYGEAGPPTTSARPRRLACEGVVLPCEV